MSDEETLSLEEARERLRAKGYLDRGVEGAVLKGALAARGRAAVLLRGAAVAALLLAAALALAATVLTGVRSGLGARDALLLFAYLLIAAALTAAFVVGLLVGATALRLRGRGDAEGVSTELGAAFGLLAGVAAVLSARPVLEAAGAAAAAAVLVSVALAVFLAVRVARGVAFTVLVAQGRAAFGGKRRAGLAAGALALLVAAAAGGLALRRTSAPAEPLVVAANSRRVVVIGVDGWSPSYLPSVAPPFPGTPRRYRKEVRDPAAFWTSVATGESAARHGVGSLDLVRLAGMSRPFRPLAGSEWFVGSLLPRAGLARRESATAAARRVPAAWEVAARAGIPSLVVNWWTTYPAGEGRATVLSNHLFFAAREGATLAGEGWPEEAVARAARLASLALAPPRDSSGVERLIADATGLDAFAVAAFRQERSASAPRLALLYLPGLDILASALSGSERSAPESVRLAAALTAEAARIAGLLSSGELSEGADLCVLVFDGGRGEESGEVRLSGPLAGARAGGADPVDFVPTALAALGVPASRETSGRPRPELLAPGAASSATVASWGRRSPSSLADVDPKAYVENLRSLGYLR